MAIIRGAKSIDEVVDTVRQGFFSVIRVRLSQTLHILPILSIVRLRVDFVGRLALVFDHRPELCSHRGIPLLFALGHVYIHSCIALGSFLQRSSVHTRGENLIRRHPY